jgi:hypothetical protein
MAERVAPPGAEDDDGWVASMNACELLPWHESAHDRRRPADVIGIAGSKHQGAQRPHAERPRRGQRHAAAEIERRARHSARVHQDRRRTRGPHERRVTLADIEDGDAGPSGGRSGHPEGARPWRRGGRGGPDPPPQRGRRLAEPGAARENGHQRGALDRSDKDDALPGQARAIARHARVAIVERFAGRASRARRRQTTRPRRRRPGREGRRTQPARTCKRNAEGRMLNAEGNRSRECRKIATVAILSRMPVYKFCEATRRAARRRRRASGRWRWRRVACNWRRPRRRRSGGSPRARRP